jgi:hypothetical protein
LFNQTLVLGIIRGGKEKGVVIIVELLISKYGPFKGIIPRFLR